MFTIFKNLKTRQEVKLILFCFTKAGDYYYFCKCNKNLHNIKNSLITKLLIIE